MRRPNPEVAGFGAVRRPAPQVHPIAPSFPPMFDFSAGSASEYSGSGFRWVAYIARSARTNKSSTASLESGSNSAIPIDTPSGLGRASEKSARYSDDSASCAARSSAPASSQAFCHKANSSPPMRPTKSSRLARAVMMSAAAFNAASPWWWPWLSLTPLKLLRSI